MRQVLGTVKTVKLKPDRMMAYYRKRAGLQPKAQGYPGWDGDGKNLTGHIAGHYLSGVSLMFAATGDPRFKARADCEWGRAITSRARSSGQNISRR